MNILFLTQWFDPEPGALRGLPLARWLTARGHRVQVITGFPNYPGGKVYPGYRIRPYQREVMDGVEVVRVPLFPSHDRSALRRILNFASFALSSATIGTALAHPAEVGFVYHPPPTVALGALVQKALRGLPFVYHIADMWPQSVVESGMIRGERAKKAANALIHAWCDRVYAAAAAVTVLSPGFKRLLVERGVPAEKIHVVYNWTDETHFRPMPGDPALAAELGFAGRFNIVYAGNMGLFQGLSTAIRAAALVRQANPAIQLVLVGTGQEEAQLKDLAASLGADNVRFVGRREFWEMPAINAISDALLVHLRDFDFFRTTIPSKVQVSLASGRPVLMAVPGDAADIVRAANCGVTCACENPEAMAQAMLELAAAPREELAAMGERGARYYHEHMSLDIGGRQMLALFEATAARKKGS